MSKNIAIGICVAPENASKLAPGYDYLELAVTTALVPMENEPAYAPRAASLRALQPPVRAFNVFLPGDLKVVGNGVDWDKLESYIERAVRRAVALGAQVIVVGSGGARAVPEGFSRALAWGQLVRFFNLCAGYAANQEITFAIEPLNRRECNILNTYLEAVELAKDVDRSEVRVLADIYHFMMDAEPLDDIANEPDWLAHVHLADTGRLYPGSGSYPLERLFDILKDISYQGMASIECKWGEDLAAESAKAQSILRALTI